MLSWLFKKRGAASAPAEQDRTPHSQAPPPLRPAGVAQAAAAKAAAAAEADAQWPARLLAAQGDDAALLRLALTAPTLEHKLSAVQALATEAGLKQAEREFRAHDRKVHRLAKQRLEAAVTQREARAEAQALLQRTGALLGEIQVPVNHLVALDRAWAALPAHALQPEQTHQFHEWRERIDHTLREHEAALQRLQRWCAEARRRLPEWRTALGDAAERGLAIEAGALCPHVQALRETRPDAPASDALDLSLAELLHDATCTEQRLGWLEAQSGHETQPAQEPPEMAQAPWQALPAPVDAELMRRLQLRFDQALAARRPAPSVATDPAPATPGRARRSGMLSAPQLERLESLLQQAEAALAEGQLGALQQPLSSIDAACDPDDAAALPEAWRARHQAVHAELARLQGWQRWGGARARDELIAQADALALHTSRASDASQPRTPKLNLKQHAQDIQALRQRWKELDRLGAAASLEMWQRFDAALHSAHQPVAAQQAAQRAARQENLAAREALLAALEALPLPEPAAPAQGETVAWRELLRERDRFQLAWRKLGPIEHTVPARASEALQQRLHHALQRIDTPWQQVQQAAADAREALIAQAQALRPDAGHRLAMNDATRQVRELQADWQDQARQLPLPRPLEAALWQRFKAATDAVFAQRDAAFAARDAELAAQLAAREALLQTLCALPDDASAAEIERTLAQVDRAWRQAGELPRGTAEGFESRYRSARAAAAQSLGDSLRRRWLSQCDGLAARLQLCEQREQASAETVADLAARWEALAALPSSWQQALAPRWAGATGAGPLPEAELDELLLQLEAALALPTAPPWQAARQQLKLRALKQALEGRGAAPQGPAAQAAWLLAVLRQSGLSAAQRERLHAVVAALRAAAPGALGSPMLAG